MANWLRRRRRSKILEQGFPGGWHDLLEREVVHYRSLDDQERKQGRQMRARIGQFEEAQLRQFLAQTEQMRAQAPDENQDMVEVLIQLVERRLEEIGGAE